jgi:hypothetical protein
MVKIGSANYFQVWASGYCNGPEKAEQKKAALPMAANLSYTINMLAV